ncbi:hypothetical protein JOM56_011682 [Amanita muscaria]
MYSRPHCTLMLPTSFFFPTISFPSVVQSHLKLHTRDTVLCDLEMRNYAHIHFIIINVCLEAVFVNVGTRSRKQRESRGFGVVTMETAEEAEAVIMYCFEQSRTRGSTWSKDTDSSTLLFVTYIVHSIMNGNKIIVTRITESNIVKNQGPNSKQEQRFTRGFESGWSQLQLRSGALVDAWLEHLQQMTHLAVLARIHDKNVQGYSALLRHLYLAAVRCIFNSLRNRYTQHCVLKVILAEAHSSGKCKPP